MSLSGTPRALSAATACAAELPVASIGSTRMNVRPSVSGSFTRYSCGFLVSGSRYRPIWPTRAPGTSSSRPSAMPTPALRIGTMATFLPAITGALISVSGVRIVSSVSGRLRVTS